MAQALQQGEGGKRVRSALKEVVVRYSKLGIAAGLLGTMLLAAPAFADIPPDDVCLAASVGKACDNAGDNADQPGTCQKDMCTRATPDGSMSYECYRCIPEQGGAGGQGGATSEAGAAPEPPADAGAPAQGGTKASGGSKSDGGTAVTTGGTKATVGSKSDSGDDGGCSLSAAPVGGLLALLAPLSAFGLSLARRRRSGRR